MRVALRDTREPFELRRIGEVARHWYVVQLESISWALFVQRPRSRGRRSALGRSHAAIRLHPSQNKHPLLASPANSTRGHAMVISGEESNCRARLKRAKCNAMQHARQESAKTVVCRGSACPN